MHGEQVPNLEGCDGASQYPHFHVQNPPDSDADMDLLRDQNYQL